MTRQSPVLHMLCGKVASGKSTLAARLAQPPHTLLIAQDRWMAALYPDELRTVPDYVRLAPRLRTAMAPHLVELLRAGLSVVLDWPANTTATRAWMRGVFEAAGARHALHVLDSPDHLCLARLQARNERGTHEYRVSRAEYEAITRYFEPPTAAEGFEIVLHTDGTS